MTVGAFASGTGSTSFMLAMVIGIALFLVLWCFVAKEFHRIAAMKGHNEARYFWWTFLLGPIGMMMVIALPQETKNVNQTKPDDLGKY